MNLVIMILSFASDPFWVHWKKSFEDSQNDNSIFNTKHQWIDFSTSTFSF